MKPWFLAVLLATTLHAETESDFIGRITAAWNSGDPEQILALYGKDAVNDPELRKLILPRIRLEAKTCRLRNANIFPITPDSSGPEIMAGKILFKPKAKKSVVLEMQNEDPKNPGSFTKVTLLAEDQDGALSLATPSHQSFEWSGPELDSFRISIQAQSVIEPPSVVVVTENCERVTWKTMSGTSLQFKAHKILQLTIPPAKGVERVDVEISKNSEEPFFRKTVDISKGAIVPVTAETR